MSYSPNNLNNIYSDSLASSEDYPSNPFNYTDAPEESIDPLLALLDEYTVDSPSINVSATNNISPFIFPVEQPPTLPPISEILPPQDVDAMHVDYDINVSGWTGITDPYLYASHQSASSSITGDDDANASLNRTTAVQVPPVSVNVEQGVDLCPPVEYSTPANQLYPPDSQIQEEESEEVEHIPEPSSSEGSIVTQAMPQPNHLDFGPITHGSNVYPAPQLWRRLKCGTYICRYHGPALFSGGGGSGRCRSRASTSRSLIRHMRIHACKEVESNVPADERIAFNGIPDQLKWMVVTCPLPEKELQKCEYYRANGKRWRVRTLDRPEFVSRRHCASDHFVLDEKGKGKEKSRQVFDDFELNE